MDLLEYQAKDLFRQAGIPVLPSQKITHPTDVKELKIPYPIVLKSQVRSDNRRGTSGIRIAETTIDAIASAQAIFHSPVMGQYPQVLLVEPKYEPERELYLAVRVDTEACRPVLLGSQCDRFSKDGQDEQNAVQRIVVSQEFSPYYARRLALKMGLEGSLIQSVSSIVEKMYSLLVQQDLEKVEISPLAVSASGDLMALNGKVTIDDAALGRHTSLAAMVSELQVFSPSSSQAAAAKQPRGGAIGILCNGAGLTMATLDLLRISRGRVTRWINLGEDYCCDSTEVALQSLEQKFNLLLQDKTVKTVLINLLASPLPGVRVGEMVAAVLRQSSSRKTPSVVLRMTGEQCRQAREILLPLGVPVIERLDEAIAQTLRRSAQSFAWNFKRQGAQLPAQSLEDLFAPQPQISVFSPEPRK